MIITTPFSSFLNFVFLIWWVYFMFNSYPPLLTGQGNFKVTNCSVILAPKKICHAFRQSAAISTSEIAEWKSTLYPLTQILKKLSAAKKISAAKKLSAADKHSADLSANVAAQSRQTDPQHAALCVKTDQYQEHLVTLQQQLA